jgi:hypothetical protein
MLDILKVDGMKTFLWFELFDKKAANPRGVSRSTETNTGLAVCPPVTSSLNIVLSEISPEVLLKTSCQSCVLFSAIYPEVMLETLLPPL